MELRIPDKGLYSSTLARIKDIFTTTLPGISTAVGSVVYELIVRPISIVYANVIDNINKDIRETSLMALKMSSNTQIGDADHILSNYFITRNESREPAGTLMIYATSPVTRVPSRSVFSLAGVSVTTPIDVVGIYPDIEGYTDTDEVSYVKAVKIGDYYCFPVPVTSDNMDAIIPVGTPAEVVSNINGVDSATLTSAIEGGSSGETDAEMIERARTAVCSWHGGSQAVHKLLSESGIPVYSSMSFDSADPEMSRVSGSPVLIGTGGMIDTYVKTSQYPSSCLLELPLVGETYTDITNYIPSGCIAITSVVDADTGISADFDIIWGSSTKHLTARGARFSVYQTASINVPMSGRYAIYGTYMPSIHALQEYVDRPDVRMLGSSIIIKAAIPTMVRVTAKCSVSEHSIEDIKNIIKQYINTRSVGESELNMADAQEMLSNSLPGAYLLNPVSMQTSSYTYKGNSSILTDTLSGIVKSVGTDDVLTGRVRFFCTSDTEVIIE